MLASPSKVKTSPHEHRTRTIGECVRSGDLGSGGASGAGGGALAGDGAVTAGGVVTSRS
jgi:hypothetical protein